MFNVTQIVNDKLNVQLEGKNPVNIEESVRLSAIQDPDSGQWYLATVPVAHIAYDEFNDKLKVDDSRESKLLSESTFDYFNTGGSTRYVGENVPAFSSSLLTPINFSKYEKKMIIIKNTHDAPIAINVRAFKNVQDMLGVDVSNNTIDKITGNSPISIPANSSHVIDVFTYPKLNNPYIGVAVEVIRSAAPTLGNVNVQFYGR